MNKLPILLIALSAILFAPASFADWHEFTSAKGGKTVWAEVKGYNAETKTVTLGLKDRRTITAPASAFSSEDQTYIEKAALAIEAGRNLWVEFKDVEKVVSEKKNPTNGYQTKNLQNGFELAVRNNGQSDFAGLVAEYQIFYSAYKNPLKDKEKTDQVKTGTTEITEIAPREETKFETELVAMTTIKRLPLSQCTGGT